VIREVDIEMPVATLRAHLIVHTLHVYSSSDFALDMETSFPFAVPKICLRSHARILDFSVILSLSEIGSPLQSSPEPILEY
jgi:hypothetical protein